MFSTECRECGARVAINLYGEFIPATRYEPAETPVPELVARACEREGEDACSLSDGQVEANGFWDAYNSTLRYA